MDCLLYGRDLRHDRVAYDQQFGNSYNRLNLKCCLILDSIINDMKLID